MGKSEKNIDKIDNNKKLLLEALQKNLGNITLACKACGIESRQTFYNYLQNDPEFAKAVEAVNESALDFAEGKLMQLINNGDTTATIFFLKTKGKKRGYIEKQEIEVGKLEPPKINVFFEPQE